MKEIPFWSNAKEAADFVLLEKSLKVLLDGIKEGRKTFTNTIKYIFMTTSANFGNIISMAGASFILPFLPMLPTQVLATNLLTDLPVMTIPSDRVDKEWIDQPKRWNLKFIKKFMIYFGLISSFFDFLTFGALLLVFKMTPDEFRTGWFIVSVLTELVILWILRTKKPMFKSKPSSLLFISSLIMFVITLILPYTPIGKLIDLVPLPLTTMFALICIIILYGTANELAKYFFYRKIKL
jgi:Mg2+-importing ATPase